jgi:hypothetical protein
MEAMDTTAKITICTVEEVITDFLTPLLAAVSVLRMVGQWED